MNFANYRSGSFLRNTTDPSAAAPMQLEHVLCQIDAKNGNLVHGCPLFQLVLSTPQVWYIAMPSGESGIHPSSYS